MEVRFLYDRDIGLPHIAQHNISENEVLEVLRNRQVDIAGDEGARIAEGQTYAGRYLRVIYRVLEPRESILVITAYDLGAKALKAYRRRQRRKKR